MRLFVGELEANPLYHKDDVSALTLIMFISKMQAERCLKSIPEPSFCSIHRGIVGLRWTSGQNYKSP